MFDFTSVFLQNYLLIEVMKVGSYTYLRMSRLEANASFKLVRKKVQETNFLDSVFGRVSEPEPHGAGVFSWSRSRHFGPAPAPP